MTTALPHDDVHLRAIRSFYGERRAERSGVQLIHHVHEGLTILDALDARIVAKQAFCLHPIVQMDDDLARAFVSGGPLDGVRVDPLALTIALEYRRCANAHLSRHAPETLYQISFAPFDDVKLMLVADKVQNRRDFDRHHATTHERAAELTAYFARWLALLGIDERRYDELVALIGGR
jgi:hypothetical protein